VRLLGARKELPRGTRSWISGCTRTTSVQHGGKEAKDLSSGDPGATSGGNMKSTQTAFEDEVRIAATPDKKSSRREMEDVISLMESRFGDLVRPS